MRSVFRWFTQQFSQIDRSRLFTVTRLKHSTCNFGDDFTLDGALQWPGTEQRIKTHRRKTPDNRSVPNQLHAPRPQRFTIAKRTQFFFDDLFYHFRRQWFECHKLIQPVEKLRSKLVLHRPSNGTRIMTTESERRSIPRTNIACHDHDRAAQSRGPPKTIRQPAFVQCRQQAIVDFGRRLLEFVKQHHRHRTGAQTPDPWCHLAVGADQEPVDRIPIAIFAHVEPHQRFLV